MSRPANCPWPERDDELRRHWASGASMAAIARAMRITKNALVGRAHRLGLSGRPSPIIRNPNRPVPPRAPRVAAPRPAPTPAVPAVPEAVSIPHTPAPEGRREVAETSGPPARPFHAGAHLKGWQKALPWQPGRKGAATGGGSARLRCQWIEGEGKGARAAGRFCGAPSLTGKSWCAYHAERVFAPRKAEAA